MTSLPPQLLITRLNFDMQTRPRHTPMTSAEPLWTSLSTCKKGTLAPTIWWSPHVRRDGAKHNLAVGAGPPA